MTTVDNSISDWGEKIPYQPSQAGSDPGLRYFRGDGIELDPKTMQPIQSKQEFSPTTKLARGEELETILHEVIVRAQKEAKDNQEDANMIPQAIASFNAWALKRALEVKPKPEIGESTGNSHDAAFVFGRDSAITEYEQALKIAFKGDEK